MDNFKWYWEILLQSDGPNYYLMFEFATDMAQLHAWMVPILSVDYERPIGSSYWYSKDRSDWFCTLVEISDNTIWITYTWGVARSADDKLLKTVLSTSPLRLLGGKCELVGMGIRTTILVVVLVWKASFSTVYKETILPRRSV